MRNHSYLITEREVSTRKYQVLTLQTEPHAIQTRKYFIILML